MSYIKWIWNNLMKIKAGFRLVLVLILFESILGVASTYMQKFVIDDIFTEQKFELLPMILGIFTLIFLCHAILFVATPYFSVRNEYVLTQLLTRDMLRRLFRFPSSEFQKERGTKFVQNLNSDVLETGSLTSYQTPRGIQMLLQTLIMIVVVGYSSMGILLCVLGISLLYICNAYVFTKRRKSASAEVIERHTHLAVHLEEGISATREVVAFHRTEWEAKRYHALFRDYYEAILRETKMVNWQVLTSLPMHWAVSIAVVAVGGYQLMEGDLTLGTFLVVLQLVNQLLDSFYGMLRYVMDLVARFAYIDRIQAYHAIPLEEDGGLSLGDEIRSITFEHVNFAYEEENVLKGFNAEFPIGKKIAVVGASGGGKSTLAQLLTRFYDPSGGAIRINGILLSDISRKDWLGRISIVFQEPYLLADTVRQNVLFGQGASEDQVIEVLQRAELSDAIDDLPNGLDETIGERGVQLSGGQRQRLALARAMLRDPELLILDEATSALDMETERRVQRTLDDNRKGRTTIIIAHRLSTVMNADLIYVMKEGRIAEKGTHEELMINGVLYPELVRVYEREETGEASA
ncbi:MAG: ABC transporter ATP-binding protein/permease [Paenibacillus sp.]|nr:ABC transporter ATP-binding protein/permease [Paenibacillus sp.]